MGEVEGFLRGAEGGDDREEDDDGKEKDAEGYGFVAPVDQQKGESEEQHNVKEEPAGADEGIGNGFVAGMERRDEGEEDDYREEEDAEADGFVLGGEEQEGRS